MGLHLHRLAAAFALATALHAGAAGNDAAWTLELRSDRHSDALSLRELDGAGAAALRPRAGRNLAYVEEALRASREQGRWRFSLLARQSATLVASEDTLALAAQLDGAAGLSAASRSWNAQARFRAFAGAGVEARHHLQLTPGWQASAWAQALVLTRWRERNLNGPVQFDAANTRYAFDLRSTQTDDRLAFPFQQGFASQGQALLAGAELSWQGAGQQWTFGLDDAGWLHWQGIPQQQAVLDTATRALDGDGFTVYKPLVQGSNTQAGRTQRWPVRTRVQGLWALGQATQAGLALQWLPGFGALPALQLQHRQAAWQLGAQWLVHERRLALSAEGHGWRLRLGADRLGAGAHSREFGVAYSTAF
jgi:hypothetical protein